MGEEVRGTSRSANTNAAFANDHVPLGGARQISSFKGGIGRARREHGGIVIKYACVHPISLPHCDMLVAFRPISVFNLNASCDDETNIMNSTKNPEFLQLSFAFLYSNRLALFLLIIHVTVAHKVERNRIDAMAFIAYRWMSMSWRELT